MVSTKDWILQYAACQSDSDDDEYVRAGEEQICQSKDKEMDDSSDAVFTLMNTQLHVLYVEHCLQSLSTLFYLCLFKISFFNLLISQPCYVVFTRNISRYKLSSFIIFSYVSETIVQAQIPPLPPLDFI